MPAAVAMPLVWTRSLTAIGTPWSGPRCLPFWIYRSACFAASSASSGVRVA